MGRLLASPRALPRCVLVTGAGGYLGGLSAAALLAAGVERIVLPLRDPARRDDLLATLAQELAALGAPVEHLARVDWTAWPEVAALRADELAARFVALGVDELLHCAGCLDYYDEAALQAVNVDYTRTLALASARAGLRRVVYVSTAYAGGYRDEAIAEHLLEPPERDPTPYTRSKRAAEHALAEAGVPWLILRPSILIGDSRDGRYSGKRYGLYQQWMGLERLMCSKYHAEIHTVAPRAPLNLLHQDVWQASLLACLRNLPDASVVNLVSPHAGCPSMRALWEMWVEVVRPERVIFYPRFEDVDLKAIDLRQRAYLSFAQVNLEIGAHHWRFERGWLAQLEAAGLLEFAPATVASARMCQDRFVAASDAVASYLDRHAARLSPFTDIIDFRSSCDEVPDAVAAAL